MNNYQAPLNSKPTDITTLSEVHNFLNLKKLLKNKFKELKYSIAKPKIIGNRDKYLIVFTNSERSKDYMVFNKRLFDDPKCIGYKPFEDNHSSKSFVSLPLKEYIGRNSDLNFLIVVNIRPISQYSGMIIPYDPEFKYQFLQNQTNITIELLSFLIDQSNQSGLAFFFNGVTNSNRNLHICIIEDEIKFENNKYLMPLSNSIIRNDFSESEIIINKQKNQSSSMRGYVMDDVKKIHSSLQGYDKKGIKCNFIITKGKLILFPIDPNSKITLKLIDGTYMNMSGERLGYFIMNPIREKFLKQNPENVLIKNHWEETSKYIL